MALVWLSFRTSVFGMVCIVIFEPPSSDKSIRCSSSLLEQSEFKSKGLTGPKFSVLSMYCSSKFMDAREELALFIILLSQLRRFLTVESSDSEFDLNMLCEDMEVRTECLLMLSELPLVFFISNSAGFAFGTMTAKIWLGVLESFSLGGSSLKPKTFSSIMFGDRVLFGGERQGASKLKFLSSNTRFDGLSKLSGFSLTMVVFVRCEFSGTNLTSVSFFLLSFSKNFLMPHFGFSTLTSCSKFVCFGARSVSWELTLFCT